MLESSSVASSTALGATILGEFFNHMLNFFFFVFFVTDFMWLILPV